jgi:hypothetical protein
MKTFFNLQKNMDGWVVNQIFVLDMCVRRVPYYSLSPLSPLPPHPSLMIGNIKTTSSRLQYHRAFFPSNTTTEKKLQPNWEQQPKFPIVNNNPNSQLGTTT